MLRHLNAWLGLAAGNHVPPHIQLRCGRRFFFRAAGQEGVIMLSLVWKGFLEDGGRAEEQGIGRVGAQEGLAGCLWVDEGLVSPGAKYHIVKGGGAQWNQAGTRPWQARGGGTSKYCGTFLLK